MAKITLNDIASIYDLTTLNQDFSDIEAEFQDKVLYRDNPTGEPNQMEQNLDMNSNRILNLPKPSNNSEAARLADVQAGISGNQANLIQYQDSNVEDALNKRTVYVGSVAELEALSLAVGANVYLTDNKKHGEFVGVSSDLSVEVAADPEQTVYIAPSTDPTGASGAWVRRVATGEVMAEWGGASADAIIDLSEYLYNGTDYTGGKIRIPTGRNFVNGTVSLDTPNAQGINGTYLKGYSKQGSNLWFDNAPAGTVGIELNNFFTGLEDMAVYKATLDGVVIKTAPVWNNVKFRDVRIGFNDRTGLVAERGFLGDFTQVMSDHNALHGFDFQGYHTSLNFSNCYAVTNTASGYNIRDIVYSSMDSCASDSNGQHGYNISLANTLSIRGCGSENNGRSGFRLTSDAATEPLNTATSNVSFDSIFAVQNNQNNEGFANLLYLEASDGVECSATLTNSKSQSPGNPIEDVIVTGEGAYLVEGYNNLPNGIKSQNRGYIQHLPKVTVLRDKSVTATTALVDLIGTQGRTGGYGGEITIHAGNADPSSPSAINTATYKLLIDKGAGGSTIAEIAKLGLTTGGSSTHPSFTFSFSGNTLSATPVGSTSGTFFFEIFTSGGLKVDA